MVRPFQPTHPNDTPAHSQRTPQHTSDPTPSSRAHIRNTYTLSISQHTHTRSPQLCNFGAAKILDDGDAAVNLGSAGTAAAHLAPELLLEGARVTAAVDAFAFGGRLGASNGV